MRTLKVCMHTFIKHSLAGVQVIIPEEAADCAQVLPSEKIIFLLKGSIIFLPTNSVLFYTCSPSELPCILVFCTKSKRYFLMPFLVVFGGWRLSRTL